VEAPAGEESCGCKGSRSAPSNRRGMSGRCELRERLVVAGLLVENTAFERHYRISELARLWGLGRETVRKLIKDHPGVVKIRMGRKKAHTIYSIPESAASRIHTRLLNAAPVLPPESLPASASAYRQRRP